MSVIVALAGVVGLTTAAGAGERPPVATKVRKQFWQILGGIHEVAVDGRGSPWLWTPYPRGVEDSYHSDVKLLPPDQRLLLADRKGRVWLNHRYQGSKPMRMYDGAQWHTLPFRAQKAMEDAAGRVFFAGTTHLHVLEGDKWQRQRHSDKGLWLGWRMRQGPGGAVWAWAIYDKRCPHVPGAWCWHKGKWHHHTAAGGLPTDRVDMMVPLGGGRCLVSTADRTAQPNFAVWSWPAAGGKPLAEAQRHDFLPGVSARHLRFLGVDLDGNAFFAATGLTRGGREVQPGKTAVVYFAPDGAGRVLAADGDAFIAALLRTPDRLWLSLRDRRLWDGKKLHRPPVGQTVFGVDRLGRIYFRAQPSWHVQVLWPALEKPGDVLRAERPAGWPFGRVFQDPAGGIWLLARETVWQWRDGAWRRTPLQTKPHPPWRARPAAPWRGLRRDLRPVTGRDGSLLVAAVRDVYQEMAPDADGRWPSWGEMARRGRQAEQAGKPIYWVEAWLYRKGRWTGPTKVQDLLRRHAAGLVKELTAQTTEFSWFDLQSDGKRLWAAYDGWVHAIWPDGKLTSWGIPRSASGRRGPLAPVNLVCLPGDKTWCLYPHGRQVHVSALSVKAGRIWSAPLPAAGWPSRAAPPISRLFVSSGGTLWRWAPKGTYGWGSLQDNSHQWKGDGWLTHKELGGLALEDEDGALWFARAAKTLPERGYQILYRGAVHRLAWPLHLPMGPVIRTAPATAFAACGRQLVRLARQPGARTGRWRIDRVHLLQGMTESTGVFLDSGGHLIGASGWVAKLPAARPVESPAETPQP